MTITLECPCGRELLVEDKHASRQGKCPYCGMDVQIPEQEAPKPPPLSPANEGGIDIVRDDEDQARLEQKYDEFLARVAKFPDDADAYSALGEHCAKMGKMTQALDAYQRALRIDGTRADLFPRIEAIGGPHVVAELKAELTPEEEHELGQSSEFAQAFAAAWTVPLRPESLGLLAVGVVFLAVIGFLCAIMRYGFLAFAARVILRVFACAFLATYFRDTVVAAATGERTLPNWPEFGARGASLLGPMIRVIVSVAIAVLPVVAAWAFVPAPLYFVRVIVAVACALYFPACLMTTCLTGSVAAVNPVFVFRAVTPMGGQYGLVALLCDGLFALAFMSVPMLHGIGFRVPLLDHLLGAVISLYLVVVAAFLLGGLYWANRDKLNWL